MPDVWTITPPNIRAMLVPDPGYVFVEGDLARADAQVCAWDADAPALKHAFQTNLDIHTENAAFLYGTGLDYRHTVHVNGKTFRDNAKAGVHAVDYAVGFRTLAQSLAVPEPRARDFISDWCFTKHPAIGEWHRRNNRNIEGHSRPVARNVFGFHRVYTDRSSYLLSQYLAWICQSTVSIVINKGMRRIDCCEELFGRKRCGECVACQYPAGTIKLKLQVHDSILTAVRAERVAEIAPHIKRALEIVVPYPDPLVIPVELKWSADDWGHMHEWREAA